MSPARRRGAGRARGAGSRAAVLGLALLSLAACTPRLTVRPQVLAGPFSGATEDGQPVVLAFEEDDEAFRGEGTIGGEPLVVAGAAGWRGVGSLQSGDRSPELVELSLSADGETVTLERPGQPPLELRRGGTPPAPLPFGPFSGSYRATRERAPLAEVTLVQRGALLSGVGIVTGDPVGIAGRATAAGTARGVATFLDGTQIQFEAELAPGGGSLMVRGFGQPLALKRMAAR